MEYIYLKIKFYADKLIESVSRIHPRTVSHTVIKRIEEYDRTKLRKSGRLHLDLFLFSYYAGGMAPIDVCFLRHENIKGDTIIYERMKCYNIVRVILVDKAEELIEKYRSVSRHGYVFPVFLCANICFNSICTTGSTM